MLPLLRLLARRLHHPVLACLLVLPFAAAPAAAQEAAPQAVRESATLRGRVTDAETGLPLEGVHVTLAGTRYGTATAPDGTFLFAAVPGGTYTVRATQLGYGSAARPVALTPGAAADTHVRLTPAPIRLDEVLAQADRPLTAASSHTVRAFDLHSRPVRSSQDLLQLTPGLVTAQHAGGGKAEQIFLRGFDADHGTDVAITVDGMPVNLVSHGHGQGYADLHFVIPETVERIDVVKGPHAAEHGNLATAGAVAFRTRDVLDHSLVQLEAGAFRSLRATALYQLPDATTTRGAYVAGQLYHSDGPLASPQGFVRGNVFARGHMQLSPRDRLTASVGAFTASWRASGQIPERAVAQGLIDRFGSIDDREGGTTSRLNATATYEGRRGPGAATLHAYASRYRFGLFSNFTFYLDDPVRGDMIEQTDDRVLAGLEGRYRMHHTAARRAATTTLGAGLRTDDIHVSLWHSPARLRATRRADADILEQNVYAWLQEDVALSARLRLQLAVRGDLFHFDVRDALAGTDHDLPHASGTVGQLRVSPKVNATFSPAPRVDLFGNVGWGFHSNDARAVVLQAQPGAAAEGLRGGALPRALGTEAGMRARAGSRLHLAVALWQLDLEEEFVYVGDGGFAEAAGRSSRRGVDLEARAVLAPWLTGDADVSLSRGRLVDEPAGADHIPLAPQLTAAGGLTARSAAGHELQVRALHVGDRPANEDGSVTARGYTLVHVHGAWQRGPVRMHAVLENAFDGAWNEAQFDTTSRLRDEARPVSELHFTPGNPRNLRVGLSYHF